MFVPHNRLQQLKSLGSFYHNGSGSEQRNASGFAIVAIGSSGAKRFCIPAASAILRP